MSFLHLLDLRRIVFLCLYLINLHNGNARFALASFAAEWDLVLTDGADLTGDCCVSLFSPAAT